MDTGPDGHPTARVLWTAAFVVLWSSVAAYGGFLLLGRATRTCGGFGSQSLPLVALAAALSLYLGARAIAEGLGAFRIAGGLLSVLLAPAVALALGAWCTRGG